MQQEDKEAGVENQGDLLLAHHKSNQPHKHHMVALTISFVILAIIIGISIAYLQSNTN